MFYDTMSVGQPTQLLNSCATENTMGKKNGSVERLLPFQQGRIDDDAATAIYPPGAAPAPASRLAFASCTPWRWALPPTAFFPPPPSPRRRPFVRLSTSVDPA